MTDYQKLQTFLRMLWCKVMLCENVFLSNVWRYANARFFWWTVYDKLCYCNQWSAKVTWVCLMCSCCNKIPQNTTQRSVVCCKTQNSNTCQCLQCCQLCYSRKIRRNSKPNNLRNFTFLSLENSFLYLVQKEYTFLFVQCLPPGYPYVCRQDWQTDVDIGQGVYIWIWQLNL